VSEILNTIGDDAVLKKSKAHQQAHEILSQWDGGHGVDAAGPVVYYKLLYTIMENAMADELGMEDFTAFVSTHLMKRTTAVFIPNDGSLWWDDITTKAVRETRRSIFIKSFDRAVAELSTQLGKDSEDWQWGRVHTIEHGHLLGEKKPLDRIFNVGPFPIMGGNEVLNNLGFKLNPEGQYNVSFGPAMRILLDFADVENSISVNPTGQSGRLLSRHCDDQAALFNSGRFRKQMMNKDEIETTCKNVLRLIPAK
jgi:penicillin amidase